MKNKTSEPRIPILYLGRKATEEFHKMFREALSEEIKRLNLEIKNK